MSLPRVSGSSSTSSAAARAAEAARAEAARKAAEAARRAAEEARRAAEEARKAAEAARKAAEEAKKAAQQAKKEQQQAPEGEGRVKGAGEKKDVAALEKAQAAAEKKAKAAEEKQQKAEEAVAVKAKAAEDAMARANEAARAEKKPEPFSAKDVEKNQLKANEVKNAFDGASTRRKEDLAKLLGVSADQKPEDIGRELEADRSYAKLASKPENQQALSQLGIRDGRDLVRLGDRLEGQLNRKDGTLRADDVDFSQVKDKDALARIIQGAGETRSEKVRATLTNETFATLVAHGQPPAEAATQAKALEDLGYQPADIKGFARLSNNHRDFKHVVSSLSVLADPKKNAGEKVSALLALGPTIGQAIPAEKMEGIVGKAFKGMPSARAAVDALVKFNDPKATDFQKAKAVIDLAKEVKGFAGDLFPDVVERLKHLDGPLKAAGAAMTLFDDKATLKDRVVAGAQLAAALPGLRKDIPGLKELFKKSGVPQAEEVVQQSDELAKLAQKGIDPELAKNLTPEQVDQLTRVAGRASPEDLEAVVKNVTDKEALDSLVTRLDGLDATQTKSALAALKDVDPKVLNETLKDPVTSRQLVDMAGKLDEKAAAHFSEAFQGLDKQGVQNLLALGEGLSPESLSKTLGEADGAKHLASTLSKLDKTSGEALARIAKGMDGEGLGILLKFADKAPAGVINDGIRVLAPVLEKGGGAALGKALGLLDKVVGKLGVELTSDVAIKVFKNLVKIAPVVGAIPNVIDAVKYGKEAAELRDQNKDLGFLAMVGAGLNTADAAFGIIADATGVGVVADIGASVLFSVAELALDIGFSQEKEKLLKDPDNYEAPDWVKAVNLASVAGMTATGNPMGISAMVGYYGLDGTKDLALWAVSKGDDLAKMGWEAMKKVGGPAVEWAGEAIEGLKDAGEAGVETLQYIASHADDFGEEVVKQAVGALQGLAEDGVELAKDALGGLKDLGGMVGDFASDAWGSFGDAAKKVLPFI